MKKIVFVSIIFVLAFLNLKADEGTDIAVKLKSQLALVKDFSADLSIKIDISYLNVPEKKGKIYFKQPNKTKLDIDGFAMLPKQGTGNFVNEILSDNKATYIVATSEKVQGVDCKVLKVIPGDPSNEVAIANLWVDLKRNIVLKAESITKKSGSYNLDISYMQLDSKIWMPSKVVVNLSVPEFTLPKSMTGDMNKKDKAKSQNGQTQGKVFVEYSNYLVNKGISDEIFKKGKN